MKKLSKKIFCTLIICLVIITVQNCGTSKECIRSVNELAEENLGTLINSCYDDFALMFINDTTIVFTSNRGGGGTGHIKESNKYGEDLFESHYYFWEWSEPQLQLNSVTSEYNEGTTSIYLKKVIFAKSYDENSIGGSDLFEAEINGNKMTLLSNLGPTVNSNKWDSHPALAPDGKILVFASDREGGYGNSDLYKCVLQSNGKWGKPINLGPIVNTSKNEYSPHITADGNLLFFASDGRPNGRGNLDIYYTNYLDTINQVVRTLGNPFNSSADDAFPFIKRNQRQSNVTFEKSGLVDILFFSSNKDGGCGGYDLYSAPFSLPKIILAGSVIDSKNGRPLNEISEVIIVEKKSGESINKLTTLPNSEFQSNLSPGAYLIKATAKNYFPKEIEISADFSIEDQVIKQDIALDPYPKYFVSGTIKDTCGEPILIESEVSVIDRITSIMIKSIKIKPEEGSSYKIGLDYISENKNYLVNVAAEGYKQINPYETEFSIIPDKEMESFTRDLRVELVPINPFIPDSIPFFVTGYYHMNTSENLAKFKVWEKIARKKYSQKIEYIEEPLPKYDGYSKLVDEFIHEFRGKMVTSILPGFQNLLQKKPDIKLEILVYGFADRREFLGTYVDQSVEGYFMSRDKQLRINRNDAIMNKQLSVLRAYYAKEYLQEVLLDSDFKDFILSQIAVGKIEFIPIGKGVFVAPDQDFDKHRHITIYARIKDEKGCK